MASAVASRGEDGDVSTFVLNQSRLVSLERADDVSNATAAVQQMAEKEAVKAGLCLTRLIITDCTTGLYGRSLLTFVSAVDALLPATQIGVRDIVSIQPKGATAAAAAQQQGGWSQHASKDGVVYRQTDRSLVVAVEEYPDSQQRLGQFSVTRLANEVVYSRYAAALRQLQDAGLHAPDSSRALQVLYGGASPSFLRPAPAVSLSPSGLHQRLNALQQEAISKALAASDIFCIHGPPGTGKTTTVVELVVQCVARGERVLACAPSNIAVDNLVERITAAAAYNAAHGPKAAASSTSSSSSPFHAFRCIRVGHPARLSAAVLSHSLDSVVRHSDGGSIARDVEADIASTQQLINRAKDRGEKKALRSQFHALQKELRQRQRKAVQDVLDSVPVTCTTLTGAASSCLSAYRYDTVVVDEAAQAIEVAVLIPALLCRRRLVLAGDHHQLGPVVKSREAAQAGIGATVMDRLSRRADSEQLMCMLSVQYRMNAEIMRWSSDEFYSGGLQAPDAVMSRRLTDIAGVKADELTQAALLFIDTAGCDMREDDDEKAAGASSPLFSQSKSNEHEVVLVQQHVSRLLARNVPLSSITVLSPYLAQLSLLRDALLPLHPQLEVGTIDSMQGRENDVVIISCVRSNAAREVGFLSESRRMNVAITRARRQACIIADSETLSSDPFLHRLVDFLMDNERVEIISAAHFLQPDDVLGSAARPVLPARPALAARMSSPAAAESSRPASTVARKRATEGHETPAAAEPAPATETAGVAAAPVSVIFDRQRVRDICAEVLRGELAFFTFPAALSAEDRRLVHEVAEEEGAGRLQHDSEGRGQRRVITLRLLQPATVPASKAAAAAAAASPRPPLSQPAVSAAEDQLPAKAFSGSREQQRAAAIARMEAAAKPQQNKQQQQQQQRRAVYSGAEKHQQAIAVASVKAAVSPHSSGSLDEEKKEGEEADDAAAADEEAAEADGDSATASSAQPTADSGSSSHGRRAKGSKKASRAAASAAADDGDGGGDEGLDDFLSSLSKGVSVCGSPACKTAVSINGALCRFCRLRFCFAHCNSILHGCAAEAKDAGLARDRLSLQAAQQGRTGRPLKDDKRRELTAKLQSKASELRRNGEADSKKKQGKQQERKAAA